MKILFFILNLQFVLKTIYDKYQTKRIISKISLDKFNKRFTDNYLKNNHFKPDIIFKITGDIEWDLNLETLYPLMK